MTHPTATTCHQCTRPTNGTYLCRDCTNTVRTRLRDIADLCQYADDKRARYGTNWRYGTIGRTPETPLPYDPRVTPVIRAVGYALAPAVSIVMAIERPKVLVSDRPAARAIWLTSHLAALTTHPDGPRVIDRINLVHHRITTLFDAPPEQIYVGRCGDVCTESLYVDRGHTASVARCPRCATEHLIAERRTQLEAGVDAYLGTVKEIHRLLTQTFGQDVSPRMIYGLAGHGMIQQRGTRAELDIKGRRRDVATYRIGEVRDALRVMRSDRSQEAAVRRLARAMVS